MAVLAIAGVTPAAAQAIPGTQDADAITSPVQVAAHVGQDQAVAHARGSVGETAPSGDASARNDSVVTGSRIRRSDFASPSPIVSIGSETPQRAGTPT